MLSAVGIKSLAAAILETTVEDYRRSGQTGRKMIRQQMKDTIWLTFLDLDYTFDDIASIIDKEGTDE